MGVEELEVFKRAHKMTIEIYKNTQNYPNSEIYGLISQMRRAASSICMNLAEGGNRRSLKEYTNFVNIAKGSCGELRYQLLLSKDLGYITQEKYKEMDIEINEIMKMLSGLLGALEKKE